MGTSANALPSVAAMAPETGCWLLTSFTPAIWSLLEAAAARPGGAWPVAKALVEMPTDSVMHSMAATKDFFMAFSLFKVDEIGFCTKQ